MDDLRKSLICAIGVLVAIGSTLSGCCAKQNISSNRFQVYKDVFFYQGPGFYYFTDPTLGTKLRVPVGQDWLNVRLTIVNLTGKAGFIATTEGLEPPKAVSYKIISRIDGRTETIESNTWIYIDAIRYKYLVARTGLRRGKRIVPHENNVTFTYLRLPLETSKQVTTSDVVFWRSITFYVLGESAPIEVPLEYKFRVVYEDAYEDEPKAGNGSLDR